MEKTEFKALIVVTLAEIGGAQMSVLNLSRELKRRGMDVTVGFGEGEFLFDECRKHKIPTKRFKSLSRSWSVGKNLRFALELRRFLKENRFDVVHVNSSNALVGALSTFLLKGRPRVVFTYRGLSFLGDSYKTPRVKKFFIRLLFRFLVLFVDREVFVSNENFQNAKRMGLGKKGKVVYNGLPMMELSFLEKNSAVDELELACGALLKGKLIVGSIGRLAYQKNYEFLIKNWKEVKRIVPEAVCVVIGDGPDRGALERLIEKEGVGESFFLAGEYPHAGRLIKGFDVFVLPSRYEGLSITTLEALFAGVPMLISKTGGNNEVVSNFDPFLFGVDESEEFKEKLASLLTEEEWKEEAHELSRRESYRFSIFSTANGYEAVYKNGEK